MRFRSAVLAGAFALAGTMTMVAPAGAAIDKPIAIWNMDEPARSRVMADSSGNGITGTVGTSVLAGTVLPGGGTGYRFPFIQPNRPPANPERLVQVAHNDRLNPGTGNFAVEIRARNSNSFGNVVQKGQAGAGATTGYWKFQWPQGRVSCLFRGTAGSSTARVPFAINNGQFHVIRCERTSSEVTMYVDGVRVSRNRNVTGSITNTRPLTIAGKVNCDQVNITCDYFAGDIDYIKIETS